MLLPHPLHELSPAALFILDTLRDNLVRAGYTLKDRDAAWKEFGELRTPYAGPINGLATFFAIPPLQWIGDRSEIGTKAH